MASLDHSRPMAHLNPSEWIEVIVAGIIWVVLISIVIGALNYFRIDVGQWGSAGICCGTLIIAFFIGAALRRMAGKAIFGRSSGNAQPPSGPGQPPPQQYSPPRPSGRTSPVATCRYCNGQLAPATPVCPFCRRRN
jgi:hypothetical protein